MARTDYYAITTPTLQATSQAIRSVNGTVGTIAPEDYPDLISAMKSGTDYDNVIAQLVEETTTPAAIASFTDGANNIPCKEIVCSLTGDNSECKITKLGGNWINANNLTYARPSAVNFANTTKRTFVDNSYCVGMAANNYCQTTSYESNITEVNISNGGFSFKSTQSGAYATVCIPITSLQAGATYSVSATLTNVETGKIFISFYASDGSYISNTNGNTTFTVPANTKWSLVMARAGVADTTIKVENLMINAGSTATSYEPYITPTIYNIPFGQTVNGGELIITEGEFDKIVTSDTPQETIILPTKTQVRTLLGANNMYHDCNGDTEVTYRANGALYVAQH